jgi:adenylate kinase family enzyme
MNGCLVRSANWDPAHGSCVDPGRGNEPSVASASSMPTNSLGIPKALSFVAVMGLPGSGKSTVATMLADAVGGLLFSGGAALRVRAEAGDDEAALILSRYLPIPPHRYIELLASEVRSSASSIVVLDGSPREPTQFAALQAAQPGPSCAVFLELGSEQARRRLSRRALTSNRSDDVQGDAMERLRVQEVAICDTASLVDQSWPTARIDAAMPVAEVSKSARRFVERCLYIH